MRQDRPQDRGVGSTYRVQLHAGFDFAAAAEITGYLRDLGVTHLYCSPIFQAAPGSTHGYDVTDPQRLNNELGGAPAYADLVGELRTYGLGQVLDIVPNHMAVDASNRWWWDVLENGAASRYASFFDIEWLGPVDKAAFTVLAPILGDHYGRVLERGELRVSRRDHRFVVTYGDHTLPISPRTLDDVLGTAARRIGSAPLAKIAAELGALTDSRITDEAAVADRRAHTVESLAELVRLCRADEQVTRAIDAELDAVNLDHDRLDALLTRQNYRLAHWRTASEELDYRRFFNIENLVGVRVEDPEVFAETHRLVVDLVRDGSVDGLRIDHVDGLRLPAQYLARLAEATDGAYTVVEKILEPSESLPSDWRVDGTSGYDFLNRVNGLFVATVNETDMTDAYRAFTGEERSYADIAHEAKLLVMERDLASEVERTTELLARECDHHRRHRDHTRRDMRDALCEFVAAFGVYRTYVEPDRPTSAADIAHLTAAVDATMERREDLDRELVEFVRDLASGAVSGSTSLEFALRLQQLTSPVMAKGVEDTAFYRYNRLISLNEVGGDPGLFGSTPNDFHAATSAMTASWPRTMLTLSTHDTKRSADVRARINVLSELPAAWRQAVDRWAAMNEPHRRDDLPDRNDEYLLYQTLVGSWPIDADRVVAFMAKATREAKVHTSWTDPVPEYDEAVETFVRAALANDEFTADLERFLARERLVERGRRNSLAQTALLLTAPGVPDLYQGTELWDLSLVDPDNRRPVDYALRRQVLSRVQGAPGEDVFGGLADDHAGASKMRLIQRLLHHRRADPSRYESAAYEPIAVSGQRADDVVAFERSGLAVVVPLRDHDDWGQPELTLATGTWTHVITGATCRGGTTTVRDLVAPFPVAVLAREGS